MRNSPRQAQADRRQVDGIEAFGAYNRAARQRERLTQRQLASEVGVSASTISEFERRGRPSLDVFTRLERTIGRFTGDLPAGGASADDLRQAAAEIEAGRAGLGERSR